MAKEIIFTNVLGLNLYPPKPSVKEIPKWYKETSEYLDGERKIINSKNTPHTIKKCIPVFDAITSGYIIYTQADVQVRQENGLPYFNWAAPDGIAFHPVEQAPLHPAQNGAPYPKWLNPYAIKTAPGYSTLFVQPFHRESVFTILPGIVDTDSFDAPVNFPFVLNDVKWEGLIPAGTPMAQIIPFKRESWKHKIGSENEIKNQNITTAKLKSLFFNSYKKQFWNRKEYR